MISFSLSLTQFDAFEKDVLIFPINIGNSHWTCAAINVREKRFEYYDSLGGRMGSAYSVRLPPPSPLRESRESY